MSQTTPTKQQVKFKRLPLVSLQTPKEGHVVYMNRWWIVTPDDNVLFTFFNRRVGVPQCNGQEAIARSILQSMIGHGAYPEGSRVEFVPVAYVPPEARYG